MTKRKKCVGLVTGLMIVISGSAMALSDSTQYAAASQPGAYYADTGVTLPQLVERGLRLNPDVQAETARAQQLLTEVDIAKNGYLPSVSMAAGLENSLDGELGYDIVLSQMLFDWGRVASEVDAAQSEQLEQAQALLVTRNEAALEVIEVCLDVQADRQHLAVIDTYHSQLVSILELVEDRVQGGYSDNAELGRMRQALGYMEEQFALISGRLRDSEQQFRLLLKLSPQNLPDLQASTDFFASLRSPQVLARAIARSPRFLQAEQEMALAQANIEQAKARLKPRLVLEATTQRREIGSRMTDDSGLALRLRLDTMQGLAGFQRAEAEQQALEAARWRMDAVRREMERNVISWRENRLALTQRVRALDEQVAQTAQIRSAYREQFIAGLRNINELISVEREGYELESQKVSATSEFLRLPYRAATDMGLLTPFITGTLERSLTP
ncbi:TolC family protein [Vibrio ostreae]|uniref:TolC family protein n=1 Tax=Vibrio ostreae TaxID=2841925 RepID=A0A975YM81_9VIBR|nr:TolC family protein [Vibrio ostreae]QXO16442.1 TolC family protein [Vibrio ostreae]